MSKRPSKKRRTIVDSSDESPPRPNTPGTQPSSSSSSTLKAPPTARASSRLKTANPKPKPKLKAVAPPPRKPPSPKKPKKLSGKYKALHSFFGARSQRCTLDSDTQKIELVEEVDDLIEEVSDDEGMVLPPRTMAAKDMNLDHQLPVVSKPGVGTDSKGLLATVPNKRGLVKDSKGLRATAPTSSAEGGPTSARARLSKAKGLKKLTGGVHALICW